MQEVLPHKPVVYAVVVGLVGGELDEGAGVGVKPRNGNSDVTVDVEDALVRLLLKQLRGDDLFDGKDYAVLAADGDRSPRFVNSLGGVVDLEDAAVGRELRRVEIVAGADGTHFVDEDGSLL